jgi:hypothetical protein
VDRETADAIKRDFDAVAGSLCFEIWNVAEALSALREECKRDLSSLRQEMQAEFDEVRALLL